MTNKPTLIELHRTCIACPSQWLGRTGDGLAVYIRYRWGWLSCEVGLDTIFNERVGERYDGSMSDTEVKRHLEHLLEFERYFGLELNEQGFSTHDPDS